MRTFSADDHRWMARAHQLAEKGLFTTEPNPRVGCVIVRDGKAVGEGFHERTGESHAEVHALRAAGQNAEGATAYVTLEPCSHFGKTPPCAVALIEAKVARVVIALEDPNPQVAGRGIAMLREASIEVQSGLLPEGTEKLNPGFLKRMRKKQPFVRLKMAMSLDGRTAMASGESQWITGAEARADVQRLRARSSAILTGIGTVLADNPSMNVRDAAVTNQPFRVVLDPNLEMPVDAKILSLPGKTLIFVAEETEIQKQFSDSVEVITTSREQNSSHLDLQAVLRELAKREVNELHVECGATLAGAFIQQNLVDELVLYTAPILMGSAARPLFNLPLEKMSQKIGLDIIDTRKVGADIRQTIHFRNEAGSA